MIFIQTKMFVFLKKNKMIKMISDASQ